MRLVYLFYMRLNLAYLLSIISQIMCNLEEQRMNVVLYIL